jgi:hypothetical protein
VFAALHPKGLIHVFTLGFLHESLGLLRLKKKRGKGGSLEGDTGTSTNVITIK